VAVLLGVVFMVPLRRALIVKEHGVLPYPEGTACAEVLMAGEKGGSSAASTVFAGLGIAAGYKFITDGLKLFPSEADWAFKKYDGSGSRHGRTSCTGRRRLISADLSFLPTCWQEESWHGSSFMPMIKLFGGDMILWLHLTFLSSQMGTWRHMV
jgi:hypothetical protein